MDEILDAPQQQTQELIYLKKSIRLFRIYIALFVSSLIVMYIRGGREASGVEALLDVVVTLSMLSTFVLAPLGLFYGFKSKRRGEGRPKLRLTYIIAHLFFCSIIVLLISIVAKDLANLFA